MNKNLMPIRFPEKHCRNDRQLGKLCRRKCWLGPILRRPDPQ
jgi:hypothetical protein